MNGLGILFALITATLMFVLPRRWALVPLFMGAAYVTVGQVIEAGPFHFTIMRLLLAVGFLRVIVKRERIEGGLTGLDKIVILWAVWAVVSSAFHNNLLVTMLGTAYSALGSYFLLRVFIQTPEDFIRCAKILIVLLVPVAGEMVLEKWTGKNAFAVFGYVTETVHVRNGKIRAQGAFSHSILAGTVGAMVFPLAVLVWRNQRKLAWLGFGVAGVMVLASASSGPVMTLMTIGAALACWRARNMLRWICWSVVVALIALNFIMNDPVYFLLARIDLAGGSTGWYRAALIQSALKHLGEWWMVGTDYTRHWMPSGVGWSPNHTDITNHYLQMGVWGGLPLMVLFIGIMYAGFSRLTKAWRMEHNASFEQQFFIWTLGAILFGHATTLISICYFDQSELFLYLTFAGIAALRVTQPIAQPFATGEEELTSAGYSHEPCTAP
jgi:hypothetical protein